MRCGTAMKTTSSTRAAGARPYCRAALLCLGFLTAVLGAYLAGVNSNDTRTPAALDPLCRAADDEIASSLAGPADAALGSFCDRGGAGGNGGADGGAATLPRGAVNGPVNAAPDRMNNTSTMIQDEAARAPLRVGCSHRLTIARIIVCNACHELRMILLVYHYSLMVYIQYHRRVTYHHCNTIEYR